MPAERYLLSVAHLAPLGPGNSIEERGDRFPDSRRVRTRSPLICSLKSLFEVGQTFLSVQTVVSANPFIPEKQTGMSVLPFIIARFGFAQLDAGRRHERIVRPFGSTESVWTLLDNI